MSRSPLIEDMPPTLKGRADELPAAAREEGAFVAVMSPNRSLAPAGFAAVMSLLVSANLLLGAVFAVNGAWPVLGFCGLDVLIVWLAFKLSYRQGRLREEIRLNRDRLWITRVLPSGIESRWLLQPYWTRLTIEKPMRHDSQLRLQSSGQTLVLGAFLSPRERGDLAAALGAALDRAKRA